MPDIALMILSLLGTGALQYPLLEGDYQVIQRHTLDRGAFVVAVPSNNAKVKSGFVSVTDPLGQVCLKKELEVEQVIEGKIAGVQVDNLSTGGPYEVRAVWKDKTNASIAESNYTHILVGDLWIAAGQSNMQGVVPPNGSLSVNSHINMLNLDNRWLPALPPTHRIYESEAPIIDHLNQRVLQLSKEEVTRKSKESRQGNPIGGVGPDFFFATRLYEETQVPIGLIPCAYGGTSLEEWNPNLRDKGNESLYGHMYLRVMKAGGSVKGMIWYQGEADAVPDDRICMTYGDRFRTLVEALRKDFNAPRMPVIFAQLSIFPRVDSDLPRAWEKMREVQRTISYLLPNTYMVPTIDLESYDGLHIAYSGLEILGWRMAYLAAPYADNEIPPRTEIRLESASIFGDFHDAIRIQFSGVSGRLSAAGKPTGFEVRHFETKAPMDVIFKVYFDENSPSAAIIRTNRPLEKGTLLLYAPGGNPYANIVDDRNMSLPAFGPIEMTWTPN